MRPVLSVLFAFGLICNLAPLLRAQEESTDADQLQIRRELLQSVNDYHFKEASSGKALRLLPEALLRWSNPVSGVKDGLICGWVDTEGRPLVMAQVFLTRRGEVAHEFQSLSTEPLEATLGDVLFWRPVSPGINLQPLTAETAPNEARGLRLTQMRRIASQFSGEVEFKLRPEDSTTSTYTLRLLSQPVYRYGSDNGQVVDGSVFALVQGTNPEAWVLIEARRQGSQLQWFYGIAPMTGYTVRVQGPNNVAWENVNQQATRGRKDLPYIFRIHAPQLELKK